MAKQKTKPKQLTAHISYSKEHEALFARAEMLAAQTKGVSLSGLMVTALAACIDTFEKEVPNKRSFKLNGCIVEV